MTSTRWYSVIALMMMLTAAVSAAECTLNGKDVPCEETTPYFAAIGSFVIVVFIIVGINVVIWLYFLIDCVKHEFKDPNDKIKWVLIIGLLNTIGYIAYYLMVKRKTDK
jgi:hypothetical protein